MSSVTVGVCTDGFVFHITEGKPYGVSDVNKQISITASEVEGLRPIPERNSHYRSAERIWLPGVSKWVVFIHESYQERSIGPNEEDVYGPFLPRRQYNPPSKLERGVNDDEVYSQRFNPYV